MQVVDDGLIGAEVFGKGFGQRIDGASVLAGFVYAV